MSVLLDTGIVYAYYDRSDAWHARARRLIEHEQRGVLLPSPVIPEVDWLLGQRIGAAAQSTFFAGIVDGYYLVVDLPRPSYARVAELNQRYSDLQLGFVDAAIVAIAESLGLTRIATTDRRHFEPLAALLRFELIP